jgi:hypothetical protein
MATKTSKRGSKNVRAVKSIMRRKKYAIADRPYEMNIVGIRSDSTKPNSFDDLMLVWYKDDDGNTVEHAFPITSDPGTYWLENPMNPKGTAILKQGQYKDAYKVGLHQGKYKALKQAKPVTVLRQYDRKNELDFLNGKSDTGMHGINIHRANSSGTTKTINKYSAGCQVFANVDDFNKFLSMADRQKDLYGNKFTYTLFDARAKKRAQNRKIIIGVAVGLVLVAGALVVLKKTGKLKKMKL